MIVGRKVRNFFYWPSLGLRAVARGLHQGLFRCAPGTVAAVATSLLGGVATYGVALILILLGELCYREIAMVPVVEDRLARVLTRLGLIRA
ncbi:MAG TPA: hypothetical protein GX515_08600 [Firmicutes bacterium]|nr:hypothetical protein [Bacillota bacterium]